MQLSCCAVCLNTHQCTQEGQCWTFLWAVPRLSHTKAVVMATALCWPLYYQRTEAENMWKKAVFISITGFNSRQTLQHVLVRGAGTGRYRGVYKLDSSQIERENSKQYKLGCVFNKFLELGNTQSTWWTLFGLLHQLWMVDRWGTFDEIRIRVLNRSTERNHAPLLFRAS